MNDLFIWIDKFHMIILFKGYPPLRWINEMKNENKHF